MKKNAQGAASASRYARKGQGYTGLLRRMAGRLLRLSIRASVSGVLTVLVFAGQRRYGLSAGDHLRRALIDVINLHSKL